MTTESATKTLQLLRVWATSLNPKPHAVYTLGSLIYREGSQFGDASDVDLLVVLPELPDAIERAHWLENLLTQKIALEDELGRLLRRPRDAFICSVVATTHLEVAANIHKDGAANFYSANRFLELLSGEEVVGLPGAGSRPIRERLVQECLRFAQKSRNQFLRVSALGDTTLTNFDDPNDPAPKAIMRHAAMVQSLEDDKDGNPGAEYDVDVGADRLTVLLHDRRRSLPELFRRFGTRRNARSNPEPLTPSDQLLLAELVVDAAVRVEASVGVAENELAKPLLNGMHSTVLFAQRFSDAFPGVRGTKWFDSPADIGRRLDRLLRVPLDFEDGAPIWWTRGNSNLQIGFFGSGSPISLLNEAELKISRIAASASGSYKYNFVYLEASPLDPIGIYEQTAERVREVEAGEGYFTYYWEEYAIVDGVHLITRAEYDDGSAEIEGDIQSIAGRAQLRGRYVTRYNLVLAAHGSPLLDPSYDMVLESHLDAMLKGEDRLQNIADDITRIRTGRY